jgi:hypothetical protein
VLKPGLFNVNPVLTGGYVGEREEAVKVTEAPGMAAPEESVTEPITVPKVL